MLRDAWFWARVGARLAVLTPVVLIADVLLGEPECPRCGYPHDH